MSGYILGNVSNITENGEKYDLFLLDKHRLFQSMEVYLILCAVFADNSNSKE